MNSSAWDKFRKQQATEREQLQPLQLAGAVPGAPIADQRLLVPGDEEMGTLMAG